MSQKIGRTGKNQPLSTEITGHLVFLVNLSIFMTEKYSSKVKIHMQPNIQACRNFTFENYMGIYVMHYNLPSFTDSQYTIICPSVDDWIVHKKCHAFHAFILHPIVLRKI